MTRRLLSYYFTILVEEEGMADMDREFLLTNLESCLRNLDGVEGVNADLAESQHRYTFVAEIEEDGADLDEIADIFQEIASAHVPNAVELKLGGPDVLEEVE